MAAVTLFPPATHDAATSTATLNARATWRKTDCCSCLWSQRNNSVHKNYCCGAVGLLSICKTHVAAFAPHWQVHAKTRCRLGRSAVHGWPAASARLHSRLNSWDWVLVLPWPKKSLQPRYSWDWFAVRSCDIRRHRLRSATRLTMRRYRRIATMSNRSSISHDITWSDCRINLMNFSAVTIFLARVVQVHLASSVLLRATIRMPTTIAISRKRSCTISADKTVVVARTLGACAVFFLVIATTTRLLWASFGATLGPVVRRSKAVQAFFLYFLESL